MNRFLIWRYSAIQPGDWLSNAATSVWWQRLTAQPHAEQPPHIVFGPSCDKTTIASCGQLLGLMAGIAVWECGTA